VAILLFLGWISTGKELALTASWLWIFAFIAVGIVVAIERPPQRIVADAVTLLVITELWVVWVVIFPVANDSPSLLATLVRVPLEILWTDSDETSKINVVELQTTILSKNQANSHRILLVEERIFLELVEVEIDNAFWTALLSELTDIKTIPVMSHRRKASIRLYEPKT